MMIEIKRGRSTSVISSPRHAPRRVSGAA
jgi:hypothetical protein